MEPSDTNLTPPSSSRHTDTARYRKCRPTHRPFPLRTSEPFMGMGISRPGTSGTVIYTRSTWYSLWLKHCNVKHVQMYHVSSHTHPVHPSPTPTSPSHVPRVFPYNLPDLVLDAIGPVRPLVLSPTYRSPNSSSLTYAPGRPGSAAWADRFCSPLRDADMDRCLSSWDVSGIVISEGKDFLSADKLTYGPGWMALSWSREWDGELAWEPLLSWADGAWLHIFI